MFHLKPKDLPGRKKMKTCTIDTLDRWFSKYIRLRDSDEQGVGHCCTCGKVVWWKDAHAGHYLGRESFGVRWNEKNVNLQCCYCNTYREGEKGRYLMLLQKKYGDDIDDQLRITKKLTSKLLPYERHELKEYYRLKVKVILKERGLT